MPSVYNTTKSTASIFTGQGKVLEYTQLGLDLVTLKHSRQGEGIAIGPFTREQLPVAPLEVRLMRVHFQSAAAMVSFAWAEREVTVSQWGVVSFEEHYQVRNDGARLRNGFSRLDLQQRGWKGNSFQELVAALPAGARAVQFRDVLGNVSSSHLRVARDGHVVLETAQRFPVFGGWKSEFYHTYEVASAFNSTPGALQTHAHGTGLLWVDEESGEHVLRFPAELPYRQPVVDELVVRVVLPEGARAIQVTTPSAMGLERMSDSKRTTWLDTSLVGRPVVVLRARHLVAEHTGTIELRYLLPPGSMLREPLMLVTAFACIFAFAMVASRTTCGVPPRRNKA